MISVIMPVYNCENYLESAVNSVLRQDTKLEIIAVDDASLDSSYEILKKLADADSRIKIYHNEKNLGVGAVRNIALALASGEFVAFCDSDDIVPDGAYSALLSASKDVDIIIGAYSNMYDGGRVDAVSCVYPEERKSTFKALFSVGCLWTKLIKRDFILKNGLKFDEDMTIGEDVVFLGKAVGFSPKVRVIDNLVYYHCHHDVQKSRSLTHIYTYQAFCKHIECRERLIESCKNIEGAVDYVYESFTQFITDFLFKMLNYDERIKAFELYKEHLLKYDFSKKKGLFKCIVGVSFDEFSDISAEEYFETYSNVLPRDRVLCEFESGRIGMTWIIKYFKKWFAYKLKGNK